MSNKTKVHVSGVVDMTILDSVKKFADGVDKLAERMDAEVGNKGTQTALKNKWLAQQKGRVAEMETKEAAEKKAAERK